MRLCATVLLATSLPTLATLPALPTTALADAGFDGQRAFAEVEALVALGQRYYGAPRRAEAIARLEAALRRHADTVERQRFEATERVSGRRYELVNLVARRNPSATPRLLLASHFDTRLWAEQDPDPQRRGLPIPGANDGSSGLGVLIELLRVVEADPALRGLGLDVVFFDGEEFGRPPANDYCRGSRHFVERIRDLYPDALPVAAIVLDMVGDRDLAIRREKASDGPRSRWLNDLIWRLGADEGVFVGGGVGPMLDDQAPLAAIGIPSVLLIDYEYPPWHTHADTLDKIAPESLAAVGRTLVRVVGQVASGAAGPGAETAR